jgi:catechol 2,3-dioxygenase-like lactoylglutathione lyase family enzyme
MRLAAILLAMVAAPAGAAPGAPASAPAFTAALMAPVIRVADAEREKAFYRDVLGMTLAMERDIGGGKREHMLLFNDPRQPGILLVSTSAGSAVAGKGAARLILHVSNLDALTTRLDAAGIAHGPIREPDKGFRVLLISDPEGNELELVQGAMGKMGA